jgi:serine/threonine protein kinase
MDVGRSRVLGDRYRLHTRLGRGGMATVYAATDTRLERPVAVKLFHSPTDEVTLARLAAEATLLAGLSHPGLVKLYDIETADEAPYLVMQLVPGETLRAAINRDPLPPARVARLGAKLADTLSYVHMRHIVHRDIKPSNVLLDHDDEPYLADFGIAKAVGSAGLTATGHCIGTAAYLAPEQVRGETAGAASDIYALGLVLLECLTGYAEYPGTEVESALARLTRAPQIPDWIPTELQAALTAMTRRDPDERPDAATCARLLGEPSSDPVPLEPTLRLDSPVPPRRLLPRRPVTATAGAAVLAGLVSGILLTTGGAVAGQPSPVPAVPTEGRVAPVVVVEPATAAAQVELAPTNAPAPPEQHHGPAPKPAKNKEKNNGGGHGAHK